MPPCDKDAYKVTVTTLSGIFATKRAEPYILHVYIYASPLS
jgi:hypothetical protein